MKISDLKSGDKILADDGFTCLKSGVHIVQANDDGRLFIPCDDGRHFLEGQQDEKTGELVGLRRNQAL